MHGGGHDISCPKQDLLTLEELDRVCTAFIDKGVRKIRLTGGEPLVRRNIMSLFESLGRHLRIGRARRADAHHQWHPARALCAASLRAQACAASMSRSTRSIAEKFKAITRWGDLAKVMAGIRAAQAAGLAIKINAVALKGVNEDEIPEMIRLAHGEGMDLTLIETMPLGDIDGDRTDQYLPLSLVRARLADQFTLDDIPYRTGGPARYVEVRETGGRLGFITPLTHNFCESCNRVRLTCTGTLYMCLGQEDAADLAPRCAPRKATSFSMRRSTRRSRASPRATISSSTAATTGRRCRAI